MEFTEEDRLETTLCVLQYPLVPVFVKHLYEIASSMGTTTKIVMIESETDSHPLYFFGAR